MRRYDDLVDVRPVDRIESPRQFLWQGRVYVVRDVLDHWVETGAWWCSRAAHVVQGTAEPVAAAAGDVAAGDVAAAGVAAGDGAAGDVAAAGVAAAGLGEREVWQVEASAGRSHAGGVYELVLEVSTGTWRLTRAQD